MGNSDWWFLTDVDQSDESHARSKIVVPYLMAGISSAEKSNTVVALLNNNKARIGISLIYHNSLTKKAVSNASLLITLQMSLSWLPKPSNLTRQLNGIRHSS
jgi:hypothetical protein